MLILKPIGLHWLSYYRVQPWPLGILVRARGSSSNPKSMLESVVIAATSSGGVGTVTGI